MSTCTCGACADLAYLFFPASVHPVISTTPSHFPVTVRLLASFPRQADIDPAGHGTGHPFLAVNGDTDSFALCMAGTQNNIVYKPIAGRGYDLASCYAVKVQLIYDF